MSKIINVEQLIFQDDHRRTQILQHSKGGGGYNSHEQWATGIPKTRLQTFNIIPFTDYYVWTLGEVRNHTWGSLCRIWLAFELFIQQQQILEEFWWNNQGFVCLCLWSFQIVCSFLQLRTLKAIMTCIIQISNFGISCTSLFLNDTCVHGFRIVIQQCITTSWSHLAGTYIYC